MILSVEGYTTAVETLKGTEKDYIKFGNYVSPEKREVVNKMAKKANEYGKRSIRKGFPRFGPASTLLYPVGASVGALNSLINGPVRDSITNQKAN